MQRNHLRMGYHNLYKSIAPFTKYLEKRRRLEWVVTLGIQLSVLQCAYQTPTWQLHGQKTGDGAEVFCYVSAL